MRSVTSTPTRPLSRRAANATTAWLDESSHCTSSIATITGAVLASRSTRPRNADATTRSSVAGPVPSPCSSTRSIATRCRWRQGGADVGADALEQVGEHGVGQPRLGLSGARRQDVKAARRASSSASATRRLADPRFTLDHQRRRMGRAGLEERGHSARFRRPAHPRPQVSPSPDSPPPSRGSLTPPRTNVVLTPTARRHDAALRANVSRRAGQTNGI